MPQSKVAILIEAIYKRSKLMCINKSIAYSDNKSDKNDTKKISGFMQKLESVKLTSRMVKDLPKQEFIYPMLIEKGKISMIFADAGIGKTLISTALSHRAISLGIISSIVILDYDMGIRSVGQRRYHTIAEKFEGFLYILEAGLPENMTMRFIIEQLIMENNSDRMVIIDSVTHAIVEFASGREDGTTEFLKFCKKLRATGATVILNHHTHRERDGKTDFYGSFAWKRDVDLQLRLGKGPAQNTFILESTKVRDGGERKKAFTYDYDGIWMNEISMKDAYITDDDKDFVSITQKILEENPGVIQGELIEMLHNALDAEYGDKKIIAMLKRGIKYKDWFLKTGAKNAKMYSLVHTDEMAKQPNCQTENADEKAKKYSLINTEEKAKQLNCQTKGANDGE